MHNPAFIIAFNLITGAALLVTGVNVMAGGLEKANVMLLEKVLTSLTGKLWSALIAGTVVTTLVQSSAAVTALTVGFVDAGLMKLTQAVGIIYGANIGTTITAQLMSFNLTNAALPAIALGFVIKSFARRKSLKSFGQAVAGFGLMFLGLKILNSGVPYIRESREAYRLFEIYGKNPYLAIIIGMVTTMLVQSSSATVGLTIALFNAHLISFEAAIGLTLGDNIGTCITAQLASLGTGISAKRTAWAHTMYNVIGVLLAAALLFPFSQFVRYATSLLGQDETRLVANTHTIFNVLSAMIFFPLTKYYVMFIKAIIRETHD